MEMHPNYVLILVQMSGKHTMLLANMLYYVDIHMSSRTEDMPAGLWARLLSCLKLRTVIKLRN